MKSLRIPKIRALDLRALRVIVAEHNSKPDVLKLGIWDRTYFDGETLRNQFTKRPMRVGGVRQ